MGEIMYNGRSSKTIGLEVETPPNYRTPRRSYEKLHIPGRNGDLLIDSGSWENVTRTYEVSLAATYSREYYQVMNSLAEWLLSSNTYARLEDTYEPDYYRMAVYLNEIDISNIFNQAGKATLGFDCKPQRFLKLGDYPITLTSRATLANPTRFPSSPIITVYGSGSGTLVVGDYTVTISSIGTQIVIDSEIQDAYYGTTNKNSVVSLPSGFPRINSGVCDVSFSGGITRVEVVPKWYTL